MYSTCGMYNYLKLEPVHSCSIYWFSVTLCMYNTSKSLGINRTFATLLLIAQAVISLVLSSLSLPLYSDSANGFIHLRMVQETDSSNQLGYVLGQFSSHFTTVAECIAFYTKQRLNIRGAEHKKLRYPVPRASDTMASFRVWVLVFSENNSSRKKLFVLVFFFLSCCSFYFLLCVCVRVTINHQNHPFGTLITVWEHELPVIVIINFIAVHESEWAHVEPVAVVTITNSFYNMWPSTAKEGAWAPCRSVDMGVIVSLV